MSYECRCVFMQDGNIWRTRFERVLNRGVANVEARFILFDIITPILIWLSDFLFIPYFLSRLLSLFIDSYETQSLMVRFSFLIYFFLRIFNEFSKVILKNVMMLHDSIRDSRYLVGTELTNLSITDRQSNVVRT